MSKKQRLAVLSLAVCVIFLFLAAWLWWDNAKRRSYSIEVTACKSNLRNLATALKMYAEDKGTLPNTLDALVPVYLRATLRCPGTKDADFSYGYLYDRKSGAFTLYCRGKNHPPGYETSYPKYIPGQGFIDGP